VLKAYNSYLCMECNLCPNVCCICREYPNCPHPFPKLGRLPSWLHWRIKVSIHSTQT